ncbi:hypothetical protein AX16_000847 [Volvariella volvacea WC 439]|nr:hypothetical protein AX16_000847 [Volvariella volvacea WC 439]
MPYWDERVEAIAKDYPDIKVEKYRIDILRAHFVQCLHIFDVVIGSNLFGNIPSNLRPACTGTICIVPSANWNPESKRNDISKEWMPSRFEPVHGTVPDIAAKGVADPISMIWAGQMMLEHLEEKDVAGAVMLAIENVLKKAKAAREGRTRPIDMHGNDTTAGLGDAIEETIRGVPLVTIDRGCVISAQVKDSVKT